MAGCIKYYYFRSDGRRWRLPGTPLDFEFLANYHRLLDETTPAPAPEGQQKGWFGAVVDDSLKMASYKEKKRARRAEYKRVLEAPQGRYGRLPLRDLRRRHIRRTRDERA